MSDNQYAPLFLTNISVRMCLEKCSNTILLSLFRKFPPRFIVELEPQINVNIGDDVKFVCIINDAVQKVHWEKDGKKVNFLTRLTPLEIFMKFMISMHIP